MDDSLETPFAFEPAHSSLEVNTEKLQGILQRVAEGEGVEVRSVTIVLTDHTTVRNLNRSYLAHDCETDVMAFSYHENSEAGIEGEIYIDLDTAAERHVEFDATFEDEVSRYAVHGLLHLIGYRDETPEEEQVMHGLEDRYLDPAAR